MTKLMKTIEKFEIYMVVYNSIHYEAYCDGKFFGSYDTYNEALDDVKNNQ